MKMLYYITRQNFLEFSRDKILHLLAGLLVCFLLGTYALSDLALSQQSYVVLSLGQLGIEICGLFLILLASVGLHREIKRKIVLSHLTKPISRWQFLLGRFIAIQGLCFLLIGAGWAILQMVLLGIGTQGVIFDPRALIPLGFEFAMLSALALLSAVLSSPGLSIFFVLGFWSIGQLSSDLLQQAKLSAQLSKGSAMTQNISEAVYWVFPDLSQFDLSPHLLQMGSLGQAWLSPSLVGLGYALGFLALALWNFEKKDFS